MDDKIVEAVEESRRVETKTRAPLAAFALGIAAIVVAAGGLALFTKATGVTTILNRPVERACKTDAACDRLIRRIQARCGAQPALWPRLCRLSRARAGGVAATPRTATRRAGQTPARPGPTGSVPPRRGATGGQGARGPSGSQPAAPSVNVPNPPQPPPNPVGDAVNRVLSDVCRMAPALCP